MSTLSLLGLYNYNNSIFDNIALPSNVDKKLLIDNLLMETAELEILYTDADFIKFAIKRWSEKQLPVWNKIQELFNQEYNPLFNVDAEETETITRNREQNVNNEQFTNANGDNINQVTGFNDEEFKNESKQIYNDIGSANGNQQMNDAETISNVKKRGGNIGVTMTQQMIEAEMKVRPNMNIYKYIIEDFKQRFCLLIY